MQVNWRPSLDYQYFDLKAPLPYAGITQIRFARVGSITATLSAWLNQAPLRALASQVVQRATF
jgi:hypothetical protein